MSPRQRAAKHSIAGVLSQLGCSVSGTNSRRVYCSIEKYAIDTCRWLGAAHLHGKHHIWTAGIRFPRSRWSAARTRIACTWKDQALYRGAFAHPWRPGIRVA